MEKGYVELTIVSPDGRSKWRSVMQTTFLALGISVQRKLDGIVGNAIYPSGDPVESVGGTAYFAYWDGTVVKLDVPAKK